MLFIFITPTVYHRLYQIASEYLLKNFRISSEAVDTIESETVLRKFRRVSDAKSISTMLYLVMDQLHWKANGQDKRYDLCGEITGSIRCRPYHRVCIWY